MELNSGIKQLKRLIKLTIDFDPLLPASKKIIKHFISYTQTSVYDKDQKITLENHFQESKISTPGSII